MSRLIILPAQVRKSTRYGNRLTTIGWGAFVNISGDPIIPYSAWWPLVLSYYAADVAACLSAAWSAWSGYAAQQCGTIDSYRGAALFGPINSPEGGSGATDNDVKFDILWPSVPDGVSANYVIEQTITAGGITESHNFTGTPGAEYFPSTSPYNNDYAMPPGSGEPSFGNFEIRTPTHTVCCRAWIEYWDPDDDPDCVDIETGSLTWEGVVLTGGSATHWQWGIDGDEIGEESETGILTGLEPDTLYWFRALSYCEEKTFWFRTKKEDTEETWQASIITLPATEVWATGATIHGLFWYKGNTSQYVYLGFQWGLSVADCAASTPYWTYSQTIPAHEFKMPIQFTLNGLLPDRTYYYRACLHVGTPPMNVNNYFGATLNFGGPESIMGLGRKYVTAKRLEDDISGMAAGRYYMDKNGNFQYESKEHR